MSRSSFPHTRAFAAIGLLLLPLLTGCPKAGPVGNPNFPAAIPTVVPDNSWSPPAPQVVTTVGGAPLWVDTQPGLPLVSIELVVPGGAVLDPSHQPGLSSFADAMVLRGAGDRDAAAFSAALQEKAIQLDVSTGRTGTVFQIGCTRDALPDAMALFADAILRPSFDGDEVERMRTQVVQASRDALDDPRTVASNVSWAQWFGPDSPLAHNPDGTAEGLAAPTAEELRASWTQRAHAERTHWVAVGDISAEEVQSLIETHFGAWSGSGEPAPLLVPPPTAGVAATPGARVLVDNPGASQTVLSVMLPGWAPGSPERVAGDLGVVVLGGTFTSRLNALLREEKGYTYGARASLVTGPGYGVVVVRTNVFIDVTGPALADLVAELKKLPEGVTEDEAGKGRAARRTDAIETAASRGATANTLVGLVLDGRPHDGIIADLNLASRVDAAAINSTLNRLSMDQSLVVVVGDLARIEGPVKEALPGDWIRVDAQGRPLP